jgi:hypothetical protein
MPYANPAYKRLRQAQRRKEAVESRRYCCPKCGYPFEDRPVLKRHERVCPGARATLRVPAAAVAPAADSGAQSSVSAAEPETVGVVQAQEASAAPTEEPPSSDWSWLNEVDMEERRTEGGSSVGAAAAADASEWHDFTDEEIRRLYESDPRFWGGGKNSGRSAGQ